MPRFPAPWLEELRSRSDIVQIVSGYTPLKRNGRKHWGLCPFHGEKTASFSVDSESQLYYCFGCKAGGSVIQFIMDIEHLEFQEAVKLLADRAHMPLPQMENDPHYQEKRRQRDRLLEANREAARFFHQTLFTPDGQRALDYLKRRGLSDGVIRKFGLGAAPAGWEALTKHLTGMGYSVEELAQVGLTVIKEAEVDEAGHVTRPRRCFDMFRDRAIFPIIDQYGNVLAFGGRILGEGQPKYLNTSDTPVFNKRLGVYAANLLKKERNLERVVLVEGYMDVVSLSQFGVQGVCATLGTALTPEQARLLRRFAPKVYLSYDGDSAGQHAILRGLDVLAAEGVPARVLDFPDGLDPDEFIRRDGPEGFAKLPVLTPETYRIRRLKDTYDLTTQEGRTEYARACAKIIAPLDPVEKENHLQELMVQTGFTREVLAAQIAASAPEKKPANAAPASPAASAPAPVRPIPRQQTGQKRDDSLPAQELLISVLATGRLPKDVVSPKDFSDPLLKELCEALQQGRSPAALLEEQDSDALRARVGRLLLSPMSSDTNELIRMAADCKRTLERIRINNRIDELQAGMRNMDAAGQAAALGELQELLRRQNSLKS